MDPLSRRRLLAVGGMAALAGCSSNLLGDEAQTTDTPSEPPTDGGSRSRDEFEDVLAAIPETVGDQEVQQVQLIEPLSDEDREESMATVRRQITDDFGLDSADVDHIGVGVYGDSYTSIGVVDGSFDADDPTPGETLAEAAVYRDDGLFIVALAAEQSGWSDGIDAAEMTVSDGSNSLAGNEAVFEVLEPLSDIGLVTLYPSFPPEMGVDFERSVEGIEMAAIGRSALGGDEHEVHGVFRFTDASTAADTAAEDLPLFTVSLDDSDPAVERDGRLLSVSATTSTTSGGSGSTERNIYFFARYDDETGEAVLSYGGSESVAADALTVYVNDEPIDNPWEAETIEEEATVRFEAPPFSAVRVEWTDPESGDTEVVSRRVAQSRNVFEGSYDPEADTVTFDYTGSRPAPTEHLRLQVSEADEHVDQEDDSTRLEADRLEPGDEVTVEDVPYGRNVVLMTELEWDNGGQSASVAYVSTAPPGDFSLERSPTELVYHGEQQSATNYRITVGGEPAATQFDAEYSTLTEGDRLAVTADPGTEIVVEWVGEDGPVEIFSRRVQPQASFELTRTPDAFEVTYTGDTEWDAESFEVETDETEVSFESEYDTLTTGDSIEIAPEELRWGVTVRWVDGETSMMVFRGSINRIIDFELEQTSAGSELTFSSDGEWPADEFTVTVDGEQAETQLTDEYDTLVADDSVILDGAMGDAVLVEWNNGETSMEVFEEYVHPEFAFDFEYDAEADEVTITSEVERSIDPSELTVRVISEQGFERRDPWQAEHDSVEAGDSITIDTPASLTSLNVTHEGWRAVATFDP